MYSWTLYPILQQQHCLLLIPSSTSRYEGMRRGRRRSCERGVEGGGQVVVVGERSVGVMCVSHDDCHDDCHDAVDALIR